MVEDASSSNAAECERPRGALRLPVMTAIGKAWLETLSARAEVGEDNGPKFSALSRAVDELAREKRRSQRRRSAVLLRRKPQDTRVFAGCKK